MLEYLFVYGTLRKAKDGSVHPDLMQTIFLNSASVSGKLYEVDNYPGLTLDFAGASQRVQGEVYRLLLPQQQLKKLDDYEECSELYPLPHEYQRMQTIVTLADGRAIKAWIYVFRHSIGGLKLITSGDYFAYLPTSHLT